jgi:putative transposase
MPRGQKQVYGKGHLHFITCTGYQQQVRFGVEKHRDLFTQLLEEVRVKFRFDVVGYVVLPTHFHLLMTEPGVDTADNSVVTLRQRYGRRYNNSARSTEQVWQTRYADTHVFEPDRITERLHFMHQEPVRLKLVESPTDWEWSSARAYAGLPEGVVTIEQAVNPKTLIPQTRSQPTG